MATVPIPHAWSAGDYATSGNMQTLTDAISFLQGPQRTFSYLFADYTIGSGNSGVEVPIPMTGETYDQPESFHSTTTNTSRFTALTSGLYLFTGQVAHAFSTNTGLRGASLYKNGTDGRATNRVPAANSQTAYVQVNAQIAMSVNDYVELTAYQNSGGAAVITSGPGTTFLQAVRLGA